MPGVLHASDHIAALRTLADEADVSFTLLLEQWSERSAIKEHVGGKSPAEAEREAFDEIRRRLYGETA